MSVIDHERFIEALPAGCSKANGMQRVLDVLGIDKANSIAFGDSRNDLDMLLYAGVGVAMGNAPDVVIQAANYVTTSLSENGVAHAIDHLKLLTM
jgi:hydroxymethylpyrimidine pyrophosphatase-like HAD family hydrolase